MRYKTLFFVGLFSIFSVANACVRENVYIGAGLEESFNHFKIEAKNYTTGMEVSRESWHNVALPKLFLGYGRTCCNNFYLAGELGANFLNRSTSVKRPGVSVTTGTFTDYLRIRDYIDADALFGYRCPCDILMYGRLGIAFAKMELEQLSVGDLPGFSSHKQLVGGRFGAGLNYGLTRNVGVCLDYCFSLYQNNNPRWKQYTIDFTEKACTHYLTFSLVYSFS